MHKNAKFVVATVMTLAITLAAYLPATTTQAQSAVELQPAGALEFGPEGVLFIGDRAWMSCARPDHTASVQ